MKKILSFIINFVLVIAIVGLAYYAFIYNKKDNNNNLWYENINVKVEKPTTDSTYAEIMQILNSAKFDGYNYALKYASYSGNIYQNTYIQFSGKENNDDSVRVFKSSVVRVSVGILPGNADLGDEICLFNAQYFDNEMHFSVKENGETKYTSAAIDNEYDCVFVKPDSTSTIAENIVDSLNGNLYREGFPWGTIEWRSIPAEGSTADYVYKKEVLADGTIRCYYEHIAQQSGISLADSYVFFEVKDNKLINLSSRNNGLSTTLKKINNIERVSNLEQFKKLG